MPVEEEKSEEKEVGDEQRPGPQIEPLKGERNHGEREES